MDVPDVPDMDFRAEIDDLKKAVLVLQATPRDYVHVHIDVTLASVCVIGVGIVAWCMKPLFMRGVTLLGRA
jgi:hypothetical protein